MTTSKMFTQEEIDAGLRDASAAIERARKQLERSREFRAKSGLTPEKLQQAVDRLSPRARTWVNTLVASSIGKMTEQKPAATKAGPRKLRNLV
jgi:hypothetical protein